MHTDGACTCSHEGCAILSDCFTQLSQRHPRTRFVKIVSTDCIPDFPDAKLPTVLLYHEGKCCKSFAGLTLWGGKRAAPECAHHAWPPPNRQHAALSPCALIGLTIRPMSTAPCHARNSPVWHSPPLPRSYAHKGTSAPCPRRLADVALVLNQEGDICKGPGEGEGGGAPEERELRDLVKRVVLQRQADVDDEDSDFDD